MISIGFLVMAIINKDFKQFAESGILTSLLMYFFLFSVLGLDCFCCYWASRRFPIACELTIPIFSVLMILISVPAYRIQDSSNREQQVYLEQLANICLSINAVVALFCTSNYTVSLGSRSLLYLNSIALGVKRVQVSMAPRTSIVLNFFTVLLVIESALYYIHKERLRLFLMTEMSRQQEQQTRQILMQVPTNVNAC